MHEQDLGKRTIKLEGPNRVEIEIRAILDTGTKPNWISSRFLGELNKAPTKLPTDQKNDYRDFNGKRFKACGKVDLLIICDDFRGFKCQTLPFLVAKDSAFDILIGRSTCRTERLLQSSAPDTSGRPAYTGIHGEQKKGKLLLPVCIAYTRH